MSETSIETLLEKCRTPSADAQELIDIVQGQHGRIVANYLKTETKKSRKRQLALENEIEIEAPWLKKQKRNETEGTKPAELIGPQPCKSKEPPPYDGFVIDGNASGTEFIRRKLRNWISRTDKVGRNALHLAAFAGNVPAMKFLLTKDAEGHSLIDIHSTAQHGTQAIHFAASGGHVDAVKLCVRSGVRVNVATSRGRKTPLAFAETKGHEEVIEYLKSKGGKTFPKKKAKSQASATEKSDHSSAKGDIQESDEDSQEDGNEAHQED